MSRKHYRAFAQAVSCIDDIDDRKIVAKCIADVCAEDNPRFDRELFYAACGVE